MDFHLFPRRRPRAVSAAEQILGATLLGAAAVAVLLFVLAGRRAGPPGLPAPAASPSPRTPLPLLSPGGWPRGRVETFDEQGLFEKIDGKADAYVAYDFRDLVFASYARPGSDGDWIDVYLYDMGTPRNAYGIYRSERSGKEEPLAMGEEGCISGGSVFARKGPVYLQVLASRPEAAPEARAVADVIAKALPPGVPPVDDPPWFPAEGRTAIGYVLRGALGVDALTNTWFALYRDGAKAFVAEFPSEAQARKERAGVWETFSFLGSPAVLAVRGSRLAGVIDAPRRGRALLAGILSRLPEGR